MKRLSFMSKMAMVLGLAMVIVSCQKQQDAVTTDTAATDAAVIKNVSGEGYSGKISRADAEEMYGAYKSKAEKGATEYVAFSIKDLQTYLATIQAKSKSDVVYVNLAVYDEKTAPDPKLVGRTTIFFSGNNKTNNRTRSGDRTGFGFLSFDNTGDYMNHGQIYP
jgi:hypothetical protein